jgi:hypothetical protein
MWQIELFDGAADCWFPVGFPTVAGVVIYRWGYAGDARWWSDQLFPLALPSEKRDVRI